MDDAELRTRIGVADLLASYQFFVDAGKIRQASELFAAEGVFQNDTGEHVGPEGVLGFFMSVKEGFISANFLPARHHLSSIRVDPRPDGSASTYACFQFIGTRGLDHWGTYRDEVIPVDDGWKFLRRVARLDGYTAESPAGRLVGLEA
jgi:hypothetical protein